jgi:short-subunit dehydrogenase
MASVETTAERPRALVTGASSGIGQAFASRLARDGYDLTIVARRRDRLDELAKQLSSTGARIDVLPADLTDAADLRSVEAHIRDGEALAMLVNNAGFGNYGAFVEADPDRAEEQIALHATALVRLTRAALPGMVAQGAGAVINVSSLLAFSGTAAVERPKRATYAASKAYINMFTRILAHELAESGVKVQALCPGLVRTEFHDKLGGRPPGPPVMEPADIVTASLAGLGLGEVICVPGLADAGAIARFDEAEAAVLGAVRAARIAERYAGT